MSFDSRFDRGGGVTLLDAEKETRSESISQIVDKKVEDNFSIFDIVSEVDRETGRFDTDHDKAKVLETMREIDKIETETASEVLSLNKSQDSIENFKKSKTYKDIIETFESPVLEINEEEVLGECPVKSKKASRTKKKSSSRLKLWVTTGACCAVLLGGLVVCNALSIGAIEREAVAIETQIAAEEGELSSLNAKIEVEGSRVPENMQGMTGAGATVDASPKVSTEIVTSDNFFNKLAKFISYLFGR